MFRKTPPSASIDQLIGDLLDNEDYRSIKYKSVYNKRQVFDPVSDDAFQSLKTSVIQIPRTSLKTHISEDWKIITRCQCHLR